jgi:hypothetical protein
MNRSFEASYHISLRRTIGGRSLKLFRGSFRCSHPLSFRQDRVTARGKALGGKGFRFVHRSRFSGVGGEERKDETDIPETRTVANQQPLPQPMRHVRVDQAIRLAGAPQAEVIPPPTKLQVQVPDQFAGFLPRPATRRHFANPSEDIIAQRNSITQRNSPGVPINEPA